MRAAHSLAAHPGIDSVAVLSPASSGHFPSADDPSGFDVVIGTDGATDVAAAAGIPTATTHGSSSGPGLTGATVTGLALALAVGVDAISAVAVAVPGESGGDREVVFPSPLDARWAAQREIDGHDVFVADSEGSLGAAMVTGSDRHRVVIDDFSFMSGIALAAAAAVVLSDGVDMTAPVWTRADHYLRSAVEMGLVVGERRAA